ncbi:MAG: outer membrane beta-barrel protein [Saprospiraceae bacterium]
MKHLLSLALGLLIICNSYGQNTLTGEVVDDTQKPIFFATIALYNQTNDKMIKAVSSDDNGAFTISNIKAGEYYIQCNMLGYKELKIDDIKIGTSTKPLLLTLETDAAILSTVEITSRLPLLEQKADKLIVNVENNMTNTNGSLLDVMKKVPGMIVINDRLSMAGAGSPTILLNGKSTQYVDIQALLRDMPGDNIKKVEIIHQPGAEYEASGSGPIINIILKKNVLFGTNGAISIGVGKGELWDYTTGINLSHYAGNINITGGLGYSQNAYLERLYIKRKLSGINSNVDGEYIQNNNEEATPTTYRANVRIDWDVTPKHRIGVETKYFDNNNERVANSNTNIQLLNNNDYKLSTINDLSSSWQYANINPYYIFEIDTLGQKLEFDANFAKFSRQGNNTLAITNMGNNEFESFRYNQPGLNNIFATALDYVKPINKVFDLKVGVKYSQASLDNNSISEQLDNNGTWQNNISQSNHYLFAEDIYAGYGKLEFTSNGWSGTAGLRYEVSKSIGNSITLDSILTRDIKQLFPSFSISKKLGVLTPTVSYSYRIDRPRYSSLNPFVYYLDPFTYTIGNPNLRPELTHSAKFTLSYGGQPFFNVEYRKSKDAIVEITRQEPNNEQASKSELNFDNQNIFNTSLFFPLSFVPGLDGYAGVILAHNEFDSPFDGAVFSVKRWSYTAVAQANFKLPGDINSEISGWYASGQQEGIMDAEYLYGVSLGVSKKLLNNKAKISLGVEDLFNRFFHAKVKHQQDLNIISEWQAPVVSAKFTYKFGNQHLKSKSKKTSSASDVLKRAQ